MKDLYSDFRKFATDKKINGRYLSGTVLDDYKKFMNPMMGWQSPTIIEPTSSYGVAIDIWSRQMQDRILFIGTDIDENVGNIVTCQLTYLNSLSDSDPIQMMINSPGGSVTDGLSIYDSMCYIDCPIKTIVTGCAASMASVLLAAGDKRYAQKHARIMIHPASSGFYGKVADAEVSFNELNKINNELFEILANHTHHTVEEVKEICKSTDKWFDAIEAKEFGIIDSILQPKKKALIEE